MPFIGYARVSTDDQSTAAQAEDLRAAGCARVHQEQASGGDRTRPVLNRLFETLRPGDTLVVVRLDRLARSLSHLLEVIEGLEIRSRRFDIEPELTAKILRAKKWRVYEMPISYYGRSYEEGKKITWRDGAAAIWTLIRYRFWD